MIVEVKLAVPTGGLEPPTPALGVLVLQHQSVVELFDS